MNKERTVIYFTIILLLYMFGCSDEGLFEKDPDLDYISPQKDEFSARDFPSANGSSWTYIEKESGLEYTRKIEGVRDINGETCRRLKHQLVGMPTDFLSANGFYIRLDGEYIGVTYPISATYFKKSLDSYEELAFEACIPTLDDACIDAKDSKESPQHEIFKQEHFPPRKLWKFPIQIGKEWIVFKKSTPETVTVVRNVAKVVSVNTPEGLYENAYLVEERVYFGDSKDKIDKKPDSLYWVVPEVGVVKYQYYDYATQSSNQSPKLRTFALKEWQRG